MSSGVTSDPNLSFLNFDSQQDKRTAAEANHDARRRRGRSRAPRTPERVIVPFWDGPDGEIWDRIVINGLVFTGLASVDGDGPELKIDRRRAPGSDGARMVSRGYEPAKFSVKLQLWTEAHLDDYEQLLSELHPLSNPDRRTAVDLYHPALALLRIDSGAVKKIGLLKPSSEPGVFECTIEFLENRTPRGNVTRRVNANTQPIGNLDIDPRFRTESDDPSGATPPSASNAGP